MQHSVAATFNSSRNTENRLVRVQRSWVGTIVPRVTSHIARLCSKMMIRIRKNVHSKWLSVLHEFDDTISSN